MAMILRLPALAVLAGALLNGTPASALVNRAFVSASGADSGVCGTVTAPCKTLQYAHDSVVNPGGEIVITAAGEYGPLTIAKALTVVNQSAGVASVTQSAASGNAVWIKAGATDVIVLKGLELDGGWAASTGVYFQSGASLQMADCVARRFKSNGLFATPQPWGKLVMTNVSISDIGGNGVTINPTGGFAGAFQQLRFSNLQNAFELSGRAAPAGSPIYSMVTDSSVSGVTVGFLSTSIAGAAVPTLALDSVRVTGAGTGLIANRGNIRLSKSLILGNGTGATISSGAIYSNKNNAVSDNGQNVVGGALSQVPLD